MKFNEKTQEQSNAVEKKTIVVQMNCVSEMLKRKEKGKDNSNAKNQQGQDPKKKAGI